MSTEKERLTVSSGGDELAHYVRVWRGDVCVAEIPHDHSKGGIASAEQIAGYIAGAIALGEAASEHIRAIDAMREFERVNPNESTKRWDDRLYARERAELALRAALEVAGVKL